MNRWTPLLFILIGIAIYAPISHFVFDTTFEEIAVRGYFMLGGAAVMIVANKRAPS